MDRDTPIERQPAIMQSRLSLAAATNYDDRKLQWPNESSTVRTVAGDIEGVQESSG